MLALISFILAVFPIVIIHEFGHFLVGRYLGAQPEEFAVGFGKKIFGFRWMEADFKIGWIPLGGYVKFKKVQFDVEFGEGEKKGEKIQPWKWFFISVAGPVSNFILTFLIFFGFLFVALGNIQSGIVKQSASPDIQVGQKIITVQEGSLTGVIKKTLLTESKSNLFISSEGQLTPVDISLDELNLKVELEAKPLVGLVDKITTSSKISGVILGMYFKGTANALSQIFVKKDGYREVMGPLGIAGEAEKARTEGWFSFLLLIASLSFAIGFFNLLPLTFLDGGRAILALVEQVSKKTISGSVLGTLNLMGFALVIGLLLTGTVSDVMRLLGK
jgi:regulator of sigma E protease